ncbi:uncharacterized protein LOC106457290 [Limulus polyphemus]|uniref:Uncharacterized protein LOC106457290 n=1 Tax=Limulus polyphemus TaxID=6850 RepID=A0ABM1S5F6_LIMPO|nr:uncharacterized protein LOC106457290 [Limulus polyphemus]
MVTQFHLSLFLVGIIGDFQEVLPHPSHRGSWHPYTRGSHYYSDYSYPKTTPSKNIFLPKPQYCPETGRTVCENVPYYPAEYIFHLVAGTKARRFNFTSVFLDEREGDAEPNANLLPNQPPGPEEHHHHHNGYTNHQPTHHPWYHGSSYYGRNQEYGHSYTPSHPYYRHRGRRQQNEEPVCAVRTMFILPEAGLTDRSEWKFVVNVPDRDPRFKQVIRVDVCSSPGEACASQISLPPGYISRCRQKYSKKSLMTLDGDGQGTRQDQVFVPSCCVCQLSLITQK